MTFLLLICVIIRFVIINMDSIDFHRSSGKDTYRDENFVYTIQIKIILRKKRSFFLVLIQMQTSYYDNQVHSTKARTSLGQRGASLIKRPYPKNPSAFSLIKNEVKISPLFHPVIKPANLSGPPLTYIEYGKLEKRNKMQFRQEMIKKGIEMNKNSPYRTDFVKLRENSINATRYKLWKIERDSYINRKYDNEAYQSSVQDEFEAEERRCAVEFPHPLHKELRVFRV